MENLSSYQIRIRIRVILFLDTFSGSWDWKSEMCTSNRKKDFFVFTLFAFTFLSRSHVTKLNCSIIFIHTLPNPRT